jgi:2'-5' RNA ligase
MKAGVARYFLALIPKEPLASEIFQLKEQISQKYHTKGALRSPAHLTLHMPFLWKERNEERLFNKLAYATKYEPFHIRLHEFGAFPPRTLYIKNLYSKSLITFQHLLTGVTKKELHLLNATHNRGFHPHITVAFRDLKKDQFELAWSVYQTAHFSASMEVDSFWLLKHDGNKWLAYKEFSFAQ